MQDASGHRNSMRFDFGDFYLHRITAAGTVAPGWPATGVPIAVAPGSLASQPATVATAVSNLPSVVIKDANNNPVINARVTFAVASGGGSITGGDTVTNTSGIATVGSWTLGNGAGANVLTATSAGVTGSPVTFTATGLAGAPTTIRPS